MLFGDIRHRSNIRQFQRRVRRRLRKNEFRVVANGLAHRIRICRVHKCELDTEAPIDSGAQTVSASVCDIRDDSVITGIEAGLQHCIGRSHSGRIACTVGAVLEYRNLALEHSHCGIARTRVGKSFLQILIDGFLYESGRLIDRRQYRAGDGIRLNGRMYLFCCKAHWRPSGINAGRFEGGMIPESLLRIIASVSVAQDAAAHLIAGLRAPVGAAGERRAPPERFGVR